MSPVSVTLQRTRIHIIAWLILTLMAEINQNYSVRVHYQAVHRHCASRHSTQNDQATFTCKARSLSSVFWHKKRGREVVGDRIYTDFMTFPTSGSFSEHVCHWTGAVVLLLPWPVSTSSSVRSIHRTTKRRGLLFPIRIPRIQETSVIQLIDGLCGDLEPHDRDVNRVKDVAEDTVWD